MARHSVLPAVVAPAQIQLVALTSFIGGLNYRADAFQLGPTESPDMLNVDLDPRGGFRQRDGAVHMNTTALGGGSPVNLWPFTTVDGSERQVMVQNGTGTSDQIGYSTGADFTTFTPDANACTGVMRATSFKDNCYIQRAAQQVVVKWTGSASSLLGTSFNDDITNPTGGNMPKAKCIATHSGYVFVANTVESGTSYGSRIRWSHPNQPEDFRTTDFIDIDTGHDGDEITAIVPFNDRLVIFKNNSTHVLIGFDNTSFAVQPVSQTTGAITQEAVCVTDFGVYFFSRHDGLMLYTLRGGVSWLFERMAPAMDDGRIPADRLDDVRVGWINRRVWVAVPWDEGDADHNSRVLVLDPSLSLHRRGGLHIGEEGAWMLYDIPCSGFLEWRRPTLAVEYLAIYSLDGYLLKLHQSEDQDNFTGTAADIAAYYTTRWTDLNSPAVYKRWKRPEVVMRGGATGKLRIDTYHDYNDYEVKRTSFADIAPPTTDTLVWSDGTENDASMQWDENTWGGDSLSSETIAKLSTLGRARAVQLKITGPSGPSVAWQVDAITLKYIPQRVRN